jgi:hypothetical protein
MQNGNVHPAQPPKSREVRSTLLEARVKLQEALELSRARDARVK